MFFPFPKSVATAELTALRIDMGVAEKESMSRYNTFYVLTGFRKGPRSNGDTWRRACQGKREVFSEHEALEVAKKYDYTQAYQCPFCCLWHIGHPPRRNSAA